MDPSADARYRLLLEQVWEPLQRYLRRRTDDADDVLAETALTLWRRLDDVPADASLAWSYGVAAHCLRNARRTDVRRFRLLRRLATEPFAPAPDADPELASALERLPEADREVLRLWAWEQLPPREIAVVLGITPNAASIRLHRATTKLRTDLLGPRKDPGTPGQEQGRQGQEAPQ